MKDDAETIEEQAAIFSALADPTRLRLFKILCQQNSPGALCVNAIASQLGISQSAISQHLRVLKSTGLVKGERRGYFIHYFVNQANLKSCQQLVSRIFEREVPGQGPCQDHCPERRESNVSGRRRESNVSGRRKES